MELAVPGCEIAHPVRRVAENDGRDPSTTVLCHARAGRLSSAATGTSRSRWEPTRSGKVTGYSYSMNWRGAVPIASSLTIIRLRHDFPLGIESRSSLLSRQSRPSR